MMKKLIITIAILVFWPLISHADELSDLQQEVRQMEAALQQIDQESDYPEYRRKLYALEEKRALLSNLLEAKKNKDRPVTFDYIANQVSVAIHDSGGDPTSTLTLLNKRLVGQLVELTGFKLGGFLVDPSRYFFVNLERNIREFDSKKFYYAKDNTTFTIEGYIDRFDNNKSFVVRDWIIK